MVVYQLLLKRRKHTLEKIIKETRRLLTQAPEGILKIIPHKKGVQYYRRTNAKDHSGTYIRKDDLEVAKNLGQKKYHQMILKSAENELIHLNKLLVFYESGSIDSLYDALQPSLQSIVKPIFENKENLINKWYHTPAQRNNPSLPSPIYLSAHGEHMRSKSEVLIAQILDKNHILYLYEKPLHLEGYGTVYPDFTILDPRTLEEIYIEHLGLLTNLNYLEKNLGKINAYSKNGLYLGDRLLITFETDKNQLDLALIETIILTRLHRAIIPLE